MANKETTAKKESIWPQLKYVLALARRAKIRELRLTVASAAGWS